MSGSAPDAPPPSYEEAQNTAPYPTYPPQTGVNPEPKPYGYPAAGTNQPYPVQQGFPQQYPYGAPPPPGNYPMQPGYPVGNTGPTYTYPPTVASYNNQQGVIVQPGFEPPSDGFRNKRIFLLVFVVIFFCTIVLILQISGLL